MRIPTFGERPLLAMVLLIVLLWFLGGVVGAVAGAAIGLYLMWRQPSSQEVAIVSAAFFALACAAMLLGGLPERSTIGPAFVTRNLPAHYLAGVAAALLVVAALRERRPGGRPAEVTAGDEKEVSGSRALLGGRRRARSYLVSRAGASVVALALLAAASFARRTGRLARETRSKRADR